MVDFIKKNWNDIFKPVVVLLAICVVIPLALSLTNKITVKRIAELEKKNTNETMSSLISAEEFEEKTFGSENLFNYYVAKSENKEIGYIFVTKTKGYGGEVSVMTAVNIDGTVKSVAILDASNETPGLGQNVTKESFYSQFTGKIEGVMVLKNGADSEKNEIDAVTGATISSRAVTKAVNEALENYKIVKSLSSTYVPEGEVAVNE